MANNAHPEGPDVDGFLSVSDVARRLRVPPRSISDLFYKRVLRDDLCPIVGGRRLIPPEYLDEIARVLRLHERLPDARSEEKEVP